MKLEEKKINRLIKINGGVMSVIKRANVTTRCAQIEGNGHFHLIA